MNFLLGLFISLHVGSWWQLRDECIGSLTVAAGDTCMILGSVLHSNHGQKLDNREFLKIGAERIVRLYMLGHQLLFQQARNDFDPSVLIQKGLLSEKEAGDLKESPSPHCLI